MMLSARARVRSVQVLKIGNGTGRVHVMRRRCAWASWACLRFCARARLSAVRYGDRGLAGSLAGWEGFDGPLGGEGDWLGGEMGWRVLLGTGASAVVGDDMTMGWR